MSERDDGGAAFPDDVKDGMSLRDYFAGQAMMGFITRFGPVDIKVSAVRCYQVADAMLEARKL